MRFVGQYYNAESGLHYNYFRDYDPELGRYIQGDPIGLAGGINTYGYVGGNPLSYVDPYGLSKLTISDGDSTITLDNPSAVQLITTLNGFPNSSISNVQIAGHGNNFS